MQNCFFIRFSTFGTFHESRIKTEAGGVSWDGANFFFVLKWSETYAKKISQAALFERRGEGLGLQIKGGG